MINLKLTRWIAVASFTWIAGYTFNRYTNPEVQWIRSIYEQKVERASRAKYPRRLLILGGSGTHLGVDALQIEQELGIPVYNMGLHAGLGLNAILASVSNEIRSDDIVVLIPEYGILGHKGTGHFASSFAAATNRPGIGGFDPEQKVNEIMLMGVPGSDRIVQSIKGLQRSLSSTDAGNTSASETKTKSKSYHPNLDERGSPIELPGGNPQPTSVKNSISEHNLRRSKAFHKKIEGKGAKLVLGLPWFFSTTDEESLQNVQSIANTLSEIAPVIYDEDLNLKTDPALFGDSVYHLSPKGRELRSSALAQQLQEILNQDRHRY